MSNKLAELCNFFLAGTGSAISLSSGSSGKFSTFLINFLCGMGSGMVLSVGSRCLDGMAAGIVRLEMLEREDDLVISRLLLLFWIVFSKLRTWN